MCICIHKTTNVAAQSWLSLRDFDIDSTEMSIQYMVNVRLTDIDFITISFQ